MSSVTRYENGLTIEINDYLDLIVQSPKITQLFAQAVAQVVLSMAIGVVRQVVVTISEEINKTTLVLHEHEVALRIGKMQSTTRLYAKALKDADSNGYPAEMVREYEALLMESFKDDLRKARYS